jgi:hypothetical protein
LPGSSAKWFVLAVSGIRVERVPEELTLSIVASDYILNAKTRQ